MLTSSPRRDLRGASAIRSKSRHARSLPTWIARILRKFWGFRRRRCELFRRRSAAVSDPSLIYRCSRFSRSRPGSCDGRCAWFIRATSRLFRPPSGILRACNVGPAQPGRQTSCARFHRRLQYRRLFFVGTDGGGARSRACFWTLCRSELSGADAGRAHQHRSCGCVPRLWCAADGDRAGAALRRSRSTGWEWIALEFRILNALDNQTPTVTGQVIGEGVGIRACFEALRPPSGNAARSEAVAFNASDQRADAPWCWRGGNVVRVRKHFSAESVDRAHRVEADGRIALHQGAVDIGQGSNTIVTQICADALGAPVDRFDLISGDTVDHSRLREDFRVADRRSSLESGAHGRERTASMRFLNLRMRTQDAVDRIRREHGDDSRKREEAQCRPAGFAA